MWLYLPLLMPHSGLSLPGSSWTSPELCPCGCRARLRPCQWPGAASTAAAPNQARPSPTHLPCFVPTTSSSPTVSHHSSSVEVQQARRCACPVARYLKHLSCWFQLILVIAHSWAGLVDIYQISARYSFFQKSAAIFSRCVRLENS
jgi:hypothetical protein